MDGPLVVLSVGCAHHEVAGRNARQIRRRRRRHLGVWRDLRDRPGSLHVAPTGQYSLQFAFMRLEQFAMERMQSTYENQVDYNLSESGVHPLRLGELVEDAASRDALLNEALRYSQSNGTVALRSVIAALYPGTTPDHVQVTNGGSVADYITTWDPVEPGDEVVMMVPNYMQTWGLARAFGATIREWPLVNNTRTWTVDAEGLARVTTPRTKMIIICNPN